MTSTVILIPARYGSTRLPGKPLIELGGKTMIERVVDACKETGLTTVVLTDDIRIHKKVMNKCMCILHHDDYQNGTERCAGAISDEWLKTQKHFINVQGDMPDVTPDMIFAIKDLLDNGADVATVYTEMAPELKADPNAVKMIKGTINAQWFGRGFTYGHHHLGVYGYSKEALQVYPILKKSEEEDIEKLEQLRWLKNGWQIAVSSVQYNGMEINSPEDVKVWQDKNFRSKMY
jgi:3-deoxy-manno-octulosonate cytidylyltransferase (CMP-KDO synthetase)